MTDLEGMTVLVTGAAGFIGSRLVELLIQDQVKVKALLRSGVQFPRFERPGCLPCRGDVTIPDSLIPATKDCRIIFHCAYGEGGLNEARRVNVEGTLNVLREALKAGTRRVVFVSSIAVHGTSLPEIVHENQPYVTQGSPYEISKAEAERSALEFGRRNGIEVVIIRPALVYGPGSPLWTVRLLQRIKYEKILLVGGGRGVANLIYVDDVAREMMRAASAPDIAGEPFFSSGTDAVTWHDLLARYSQMLGKSLPASCPRWRAKLLCQKDRWGFRLAGRPVRIELFDLQSHLQTARFSMEKAERFLSFRPEISFSQGMEKTEDWLRRAGYLSA